MSTYAKCRSETYGDISFDAMLVAVVVSAGIGIN